MNSPLRTQNRMLRKSPNLRVTPGLDLTQQDTEKDGQGFNTFTWFNSVMSHGHSPRGNLGEEDHSRWERDRHSHLPGASVPMQKCGKINQERGNRHKAKSGSNIWQGVPEWMCIGYTVPEAGGDRELDR